MIMTMIKMNTGGNHTCSNNPSSGSVSAYTNIGTLDMHDHSETIYMNVNFEGIT